jgi:hypothetical protein
VSTRVAVATAAEFPDLDEDGPALLAALRHRGLVGEPAVWTDPDVDWASYAAVVVRCTWDYQDRRDDFLAWAERVAAVTRLANPPEVLRWNSRKTYLRDLAGAGLPVVTTEWLAPGDAFEPPAWEEYVVKPVVSAGSRDTNRYRAGEHDRAAAEHADGLLAAGREVMLQPYLHEVDTYGETALFFFAGGYSHAVRKGPLLEPAMAFVEGAYKEEEIEPRQPSDAERDVAEQVLDRLASVGPAQRHALTYARVDLVPGTDASPTVLEVELVEPSMFLVHDGGHGDRAADRFAAAIAALVGR